MYKRRNNPQLRRFFPALAPVLILSAACNKSSPTSSPDLTRTSAAIQTTAPRHELTNATKTATGEPSIYSYEVINIWPHDRNAFTQGLVFLDGTLLESTGLNGQSTLRKVDLKTGAVLKQVKVPDQYFA